MIILQEIVDLVDSAVSEISVNTDIQKCWVIFKTKLFCVLAKYPVNRSDFFDTLFFLLTKRDRRVVLITVLFLGEAYDLFTCTERERAIEAINHINRASSDKVLQIAKEISSALLGFDHAIDWVKAEMQRNGVSDFNTYIKGMEIALIKEISDGWM